MRGCCLFKHSGLEYNNQLQLDTGLPTSRTQRVWTGSCTFSVLVPWLHSQTSTELYCEVCGWHHHHQFHWYPFKRISEISVSVCTAKMIQEVNTHPATGCSPCRHLEKNAICCHTTRLQSSFNSLAVGLLNSSQHSPKQVKQDPNIVLFF